MSAAGYARQFFLHVPALEPYQSHHHSASIFSANGISATLPVIQVVVL